MTNQKTKIDHLELWNKVEKTDPSHTKSVSGAGRNLTAINAQQQMKNATSEFGKYGEGWGLKDIKLDYINGLAKSQILATAQAVFFYPQGQFEIGSSILVQSFVREKEWNGKITPAYNNVDDDFLKKLETDMMTKSLSKLGFNADVFLGYYDDNKYVQAMKAEFSEVPEQKKPETKPAKEKKPKLLPVIKEADKTKILLAADLQTTLKSNATQITNVINTFKLEKDQKDLLLDKLKELEEAA